MYWQKSGCTYSYIYIRNIALGQIFLRLNDKRIPLTHYKKVGLDSFSNKKSDNLTYVKDFVEVYS